MGKARYIPKCIIKHDWIDYTGKDNLHIRNESFYGRDGKNFERRKRLSFNPKLL
jgi:hypothetical protein